VRHSTREVLSQSATRGRSLRSERCNEIKTRRAPRSSGRTAGRDVAEPFCGSGLADTQLNAETVTLGFDGSSQALLRVG